MHKVEELVRANPRMTAIQVAEATGLSRARVYQILSKAGLKAFASYEHPRRLSDECQLRTNRMIGGGKFTASMIGDISEVIAATDLLKRGSFVFRSMTANSPCDIIAMAGEQMSRIEVRTARATIDGTWSYSRPEDTGRYDILCLVHGDTGEIRYLPKPGHEWITDSKQFLSR